MHVWLLSIGEMPPLDNSTRLMRIGLLARELAARGHQVTRWASAFHHMKKQMLLPDDRDIELEPGLLIKALKGKGYSRNVSFQRYQDHKIIASKFARMARKLPRPDIIVACMPDYRLAYEAVKYAKEIDVPVIVDVRDQWPDTFLDLLPASFLKPVARLLLQHEFSILKKTIRQADAIVSVNSVYLSWALKYAGRDATAQDKVFFLGAKKLVDCDPAELLPEFREMLDKLKGKFVVAYVGTFGRNTDPYVIAQAAKVMRESKTAGDDCVFVLAGTGTSYDKVMALSKELDNVFVPGWINEKEISALLRVSSIGVIPCLETFPNKAFTYMSGGLPILSSTTGDLREMIERDRIGLYFRPDDPVDLAKAIRTLRSDPSLCAEMAANSQRLLDEKMNSDIIYGDYANHIEVIAASQQAIAPA